MCLHIKGTPKVLKAKKAIKVYKAFNYVTPSGFGITPYQHARYRRGVIKRTRVFSTDGGSYRSGEIRFTNNPPAGAATVDRGIHSYSSLAAARRHGYGRIIVQCVIPHGTLYMRGKHSEVVSLALKSVKAIAGPADDVQRFNARRPRV